MSNLNSISEICKTVALISIIFIIILIFSVQRVQKWSEIQFRINYFDNQFNLSKMNYFLNYDDDSIDEDFNVNSDSEINAINQENAYLVLLAMLQKSDLLIYFEVIQNIDDEISSFSDKVFITKKQLFHKDFIKSASYKEAMNSLQYNCWIAAMQVEINKLIRIKIWKLIKLLKEWKIIKEYWVYYIKLSANNEIIKFKACWMTKNFE